MWFPFRLPGRGEAEFGLVGPFDVGPLPRLERDESEGLRWLLMEPSLWGEFDRTMWEAELARQRQQLAGRRVPDAFGEFWSSVEYFARIPEWWGWTFGIGGHAIPVSDGGVLIRFISDQQDCIHWYLYLGPDDSEAIVGMYALFGDEPDPDDTPEDLADLMDDFEVTSLDRYIVGEGNAVVYAESFFEFITRYWLEREIERRLLNNEVLTEEQERYVSMLASS